MTFDDVCKKHKISSLERSILEKAFAASGTSYNRHRGSMDEEEFYAMAERLVSLGLLEKEGKVLPRGNEGSTLILYRFNKRILV